MPSAGSIVILVGVDTDLTLLQEIFTRLLQRYLYSQKPRHLACAIFSTVLSAVSFIREMADIKKSRAINQNVKVPS